MELTIEQALQQGLAAHKEGKLQAAESLYQAVLQAQPLHPAANHNLGVIAVSANKAELALPLFKTALEANPKIGQFWLSYIDALIKENQLETANSVIEQGRKVGLVGDKIDALKSQLQLKGQPALPKLSEKKKSLTLKEKRKQIAKSKQQKKQLKIKSANRVGPSQGQIDILLEHYQSGQYGEAEKLALTITQQFPGHQFSWKVLGAIFKQVGKLTESLNAKEQAVQLDPQDYEAHYNLGNAFEELSRLEEAEGSFRRSILLKPDYAKAHLNLGNTVKNLGKLEEAEVSYRQAKTLQPDLAKAHFNLGITLRELDRLDEAEVSYRQAIAVKPDYVEAHQNLGILLKDLGRLQEAEVSYRQAIFLKPDVALAHFNLGITLKELGRLDEAEVSYRQAIVLKPDFTDVHYNLGITLQELGRLEEAEASYTQAIVLRPDYAEAHNNLGGVLKDLDRLDEAEASYTQAIVLKPNYTEALVNRWQLLFDKKEFDTALRDIDLCNTEKSRACSLETLYALGSIDEIYKRIEMQAETDDGNIRMAAFSAFISEREQKNTAHEFCRNPQSFIHFSNISSHLEDASAFITGVIGELNKKETIWEPKGRTTVKGFQTPNHINLFENPSGKISQLKSIILDELNVYYLKFQNESCSFIKKWPSKKNLHGWHVNLKKQGFQYSHIHPGGWLSGVVYLKVVPSLKKDEGAIEFSLNSPNYSDLKSPRLLHQPAPGDIVFFPSSLHHRTIPFTTDADRIIVSFDLIPEVAKY
jgi:tetratricopeptide (TPR) repeat protein